MKRLALILAVSWLAAPPAAKAGELDAEFGGKPKTSTPAPALETPPSELDAEAPDQACHRRWRRGYYGLRGYGYGSGYPAFGFGFGYSRGYYGYGYGRGFGYGRGRW